MYTLKAFLLIDYTLIYFELKVWCVRFWLPHTPSRGHGVRCVHSSVCYQRGAQSSLLPTGWLFGDVIQDCHYIYGYAEQYHNPWNSRWKNKINNQDWQYKLLYWNREISAFSQCFFLHFDRKKMPSPGKSFLSRWYQFTTHTLRHILHWFTVIVTLYFVPGFWRVKQESLSEIGSFCVFFKENYCRQILVQTVCDGCIAYEIIEIGNIGFD